MAGFKRWKKAQEYEGKHWEKLAERIALNLDDLDWYKWKADQLNKRFLSKVPQIDFAEENILEIGSGPVGIIAFLKGKKRYAIEPLEDFFKNKPLLAKSRNKEVQYLKGTGESLPFEDDYFSLVVIDNVLDHTLSPLEVLKETFRVLVPGGFLYLMVNVHSAWGVKARFLMEVFQLDRGHPHSFTATRIRQFLQNGGFEIQDEELENSWKVKLSDLKSRHLKNQLKGILGISEIQYQVLAKRRET
jgi:ubiquinone/menaquinone biosynthesis C-methylase UbiE